MRRRPTPAAVLLALLAGAPAAATEPAARDATASASSPAARADDPVAVAMDPAATDPADAQRNWASNWRDALDNDFYKISLDIRLRQSLADIDGFRTSSATTLRTRFGIGTKPWRGLSLFAEAEGTIAFANRLFFDNLGNNNKRRSTVADPSAFQLNRGFGRYHRPEFYDVDLIGGRQRIIFDDARFIGNVGWRQNEQTYDAGFGSTSLGIEGLEVGYGYLWHINRIFSDRGQDNTKDWDSRSHLVRVSYDRFELAELTGFAYLLDFKNDSPGNSANTFGFRVKGNKVLDGVWKFGYVGSFAHQGDTGNNTVDYDALYGWVEGIVGHAQVLTVGVGHEWLGSDDGEARFVTPLSTAHKFNGFADAFLDNGGPNGLRNLFVWLSPNFPLGVKGKLYYHRFWSDERGEHLGDEFDFVLTRKFNRILALTKFAWFDGTKSGGVADRWRFTFEVNFKY